MNKGPDLMNIGQFTKLLPIVYHRISNFVIFHPIK